MKYERQQVVALISGGGSTVEQIIHATQDGRLSRTQVAAVITSNPLSLPETRFQLLRDMDIPLFTVNPSDYETNEAYGEALLDDIRPFNPDVIGQYGHTPLTPSGVIAEFRGRMINQHPGPVDPGPYDFGGRGMSSAERTHAARLLFVRETKRNYWTDVTAQRVDDTFDKGAVLKRGRVHILPTDTVDTLKALAIQKEWEVQIATLYDFQEGQVIELPPYDDLVLPTERDILKTSKRFARHLYPAE